MEIAIITGLYKRWLKTRKTESLYQVKEYPKWHRSTCCLIVQCLTGDYNAITTDGCTRITWHRHSNTSYAVSDQVIIKPECSKIFHLSLPRSIPSESKFFHLLLLCLVVSASYGPLLPGEVPGSKWLGPFRQLQPRSQR